MTDSTRSSPVTNREVLAAQIDRRWDSSVGMRLLGRLNGADYLSLVALLFAWLSAVLLLYEEPNWGILVMLGAYIFDKLDGWYARRKGISSPFGRQVDSFIDIFAYLVTGALLYHVALAPEPWLTVVVGFAILAFGGLRLVRHAAEGFGDSNGTSYYIGMTVVHVNVAIVCNYFLATFVAGWNGWFATIPIVLICPMMISGYKSYKNGVGHALAAAGGLTAGILALWLELGEIAPPVL